MRERIARGLLLVAVFGSAMALGSVHTLVLVVVTCVLAGAAALAWWGTPPMRARSAASILFWVGVGLTGFTLLQVVPMPAAWLATIAPANADVWARCLLPLREPGPSWATISLDPIATRVEVLRGVAYLLAFLTALQIAQRRSGVKFLEGVLIATGLALAIAAWVHPALGAEKVFGIYQPLQNPGDRHMAPILNGNALSGYLNISLCILFAQTLAPRALLPRPVAIALLAFMIATQFWVASRGGMLGTACGMVAVVWLTLGAKKAEGTPRVSVLLVVFLLAVAVGMGVLASSETAWLELATTDTSKLEVVRQAFRMVLKFPIFGTGRGTFTSTFPAFRTGYSHIVFTHPENIVAEWVTGWGLVVAGVAGIALLYALRPTTVLSRSTAATGAWAGLVCVALHNLVDFSSEFPGVVIALVACGAIVTGGASGMQTPAWTRHPSSFAIGAVGVAVLAVLFVLPGSDHELRGEEQELRALALDPGVSRDRFHIEARASMLRHPAEPYLPFAGGLRAMRARDESVVPWIERTLERALVYGPAHLLLARAFRGVSPAQARLEYRLALEQAPELGGTTLPEILSIVHGYHDAVDAMPTREPAAALDLFIGLVNARLPATAARLDEDLAAVDPNAERAASRHALHALEDLRDGEAATWCSGEARKACLDRALAESTRLERLAPSRCEGFWIRAQVLVEAGDASRAVSEVKNATDRVADRPWCLKQLVELASNAKEDAVVTQALDQLARGGCVEAADCVANLRFVASREQARGNPRRALVALQRAREQTPGDDTLLADVAQLASRVDLHGEALQAYQELARRQPADARWRTAVEKERAAAVEGAIRP